MIRIVALAAAVLTFAVGCSSGSSSLPEKPQLIVDRDTLGFGQEFGSATFIGTAPQDSIQLTNGGLTDLTISSVAQSGDNVFQIEGPQKTTLKGNEKTFIRVVFAPTSEKVYSGSLLITSNAANLPMKTIGLSGSGLACQKLSSTTDAGCKVEYECSDGGNPVVNCEKVDGGASNCTCLFNGVSTALNNPNLCSLDRAGRIAATRSVCNWSL